YAQKEIRDALEKAEEKPEGAIFLIPVRWDNCKIPRKLADIQYVDIFERDGYEKLLKALDARAKNLGLSFVGRKAFQPPKPDTAYEVRNLVKNMLRDEDGLQESLLYLRDKEPDGYGWLHRQIHSELQTIMGNQNRLVNERARSGDILSILGDPRFRADAWYLPDDNLLGFVEIPAGTFLLGEDAPQKQGGNGQHSLFLPEFYIGRYPVTVAQYRSFLADIHAQTELIPSEPRVQNHPVTSVSWHEALQYCAWLTEKLFQWTGTPAKIAHCLKELSWVVTLPSEVEWEKAARGIADQRAFPWGSTVDSNQANYTALALGHSTSVGCFETGKSPYGIYDLAGNVCEWTRSIWGPNVEKPQFTYPYQDDAREDVRASNQMLRVCRGGSCYSPAEHIRCSHREADFPYARREHIGFRLAITLLSSS
ncbi:MAG TPA: SUMF1/EgtB/PvdO family nonheme iron enzyme, partial [Anaerolineales bacterium]|nr:SUMF1/EgtB/PvdO family nonheme iron enzyme [Anaerolineales bacterium]